MNYELLPSSKGVHKPYLSHRLTRSMVPKILGGLNLMK